MSKFEKNWKPTQSSGSFAQKTRETIRGPKPLKPQIQKATSSLNQEVHRLDGALSRLKQRETSIFKKTVLAVQHHDEQTSKAYSNELAEIKKMTKIVTQSKIALGSGGIFGKGFLQGTQSRLNFLPEAQTDFIWTSFCEEFGFVGAVALLILFAVVIGYGIQIAMSARSQFARLLAMGITLNFFFYIMINGLMVMGLIPVVGIPMPLLSYGGTAMLTVMFGFGLLMSVHVHRQVEIPRHSGGII